jgi:hypothetical protein
MSQRPSIADLQRRLYEQLTNGGSMPTKSTTSIEHQAGELKEAASRKVVHVVLDGKYDALMTFKCS